jgi:hypothetical protein
MTPWQKVFSCTSLARDCIPEAQLSTALPWGLYDVRAVGCRVVERMANNMTDHYGGRKEDLKTDRLTWSITR